MVRDGRVLVTAEVTSLLWVSLSSRLDRVIPDAPPLRGRESSQGPLGDCPGRLRGGEIMSDTNATRMGFPVDSRATVCVRKLQTSLRLDFSFQRVGKPQLQLEEESERAEKDFQPGYISAASTVNSRAAPHTELPDDPDSHSWVLIQRR